MRSVDYKCAIVVGTVVSLLPGAAVCSARTIHVRLSAVKESGRYIQYEPIELAVAFENELDENMEFTDLRSRSKVSSFLEMRRADGTPVYFAGPSHPAATHSPKRITLAPGEEYRGIVDINRPFDRFEIHAGGECEVRVNATIAWIGDERLMIESDWITLSIVEPTITYEKTIETSIDTPNHPRRIPVVWTVYIDATEMTKRLLYKQDVRTASEMPLDFEILGGITDQESLSVLCDEEGDLHLLMSNQNGEFHKHHSVMILGSNANRGLWESLRREGYRRTTLAQVVDYYKDMNGGKPRLEVIEGRVAVVNGQRIPRDEWPTTQPAGIETPDTLPEGDNPTPEVENR